MSQDSTNSIERGKELQQRVAVALANTPALRRVSVSTHEGAVVLRGHVHSFYAKQLLQHAARRAAAHSPVIDEVGVLPPAGLIDTARLRSVAAAGIALVVLALVTGCSRSESGQVEVHPVTGRVAIGGKPAAGALVIFHAKDGRERFPAPRAKTDQNGKFLATTYADGDGAPSGSYVITVELHRLVQQDGEYVRGESLVPPQYSNRQTSTLVAQVAEGSNEIPISIVR